DVVYALWRKQEEGSKRKRKSQQRGRVKRCVSNCKTTTLEVITEVSVCVCVFSMSSPEVSLLLWPGLVCVSVCVRLRVCVSVAVWLSCLHCLHCRLTARSSWVRFPHGVLLALGGRSSPECTVLRWAISRAFLCGVCMFSP